MTAQSRPVIDGLTDDGPIAAGDRCDAAELAGKFAPSIFNGIENGRVGIEDGGRKVVGA
jgi:hypothetical protein